MNAAPTDASPRYASKRVRGGPVNSTKTSRPNEPNAAKSDVCGFPITLSASAKTAGMTIAARAALLTAATSATAPRPPAQAVHAFDVGRATALVSQDGAMVSPKLSL